MDQHYAEPIAQTHKMAKILIIGVELEQTLQFLKNPQSPFEVISGHTPVGIIKSLSEDNPPLIICELDFKGRAITEMLEKIDNMGALTNRQIILCANNVETKDLIKLKMLKVQDVFPNPVPDPQAFIEKLKSMLKE